MEEKYEKYSVKYDLASAYPHGIVCLECERIIHSHQPYARRYSRDGDEWGPHVELVCVYCVTEEDNLIFYLENMLRRAE